MSERHLAVGAGQEVVDGPPINFEKFGRDRSDRRCGRNGETFFHVLDDACRCATQFFDRHTLVGIGAIGGPVTRASALAAGVCRCRLAGGIRSISGGRGVVGGRRFGFRCGRCGLRGEVLLPVVWNRVRIGQPPFAQCLHDSRVGAEFLPGIGRSH